MRVPRAVFSGALVWALIFALFAALDSFSPLTLNEQAIVIAILIVPIAVLGASLYYRRGNSGNGWVIGLIMASTALGLDALITVPLVEIPDGGSYHSFFTYPLLWLLVLVNVATVGAYWSIKINRG